MSPQINGKQPLKTNLFPYVKEIFRMSKPLGFCAFEGWSKSNFYFFDRDKKNTVLSVKVLNPE